MKLQHTLGGIEGLDAIEPEWRVFVEPWETRIFGIHTAMMALSTHLTLPDTSSTFRTVWTWADLRKGAESLNPLDYFRYRYYEKWLGGISDYCVSNGYVTESEIEAAAARYRDDPTVALPEGGDNAIDDRINRYLIDGDSPKAPHNAAPKHAEGDRVVIADPPTIEHTRLPGHLRNKVGVVETVYEGAYGYFCSTGPDGIGPAMPVYCVKFDPQDIWPGNTEPGLSLYADLFEAYVLPFETRIEVAA